MGTPSPSPGAQARPGKAATRVEIYDQGYTIGGDNNAEYVQRLAARVDAKMRQVARETRVVDSVRVAVLTAINLADENESLRAEIARLERQTAERARGLNRSLDAALRQG